MRFLRRVKKEGGWCRSRKRSSRAKGRARAAANGHPSIAPTANHSVAWRDRVNERDFKETAKAIVVVYIAKDEGRKAGAEMKRPAEPRRRVRRRVAVFVPYASATVRHK